MSRISLCLFSRCCKNAASSPLCPGGTIRSANWGIVATAQLATVADQGAVVGTFGSGVYLLAGGYVSNSASSVITAGYFGVQITGAAATVTWRGRRADCLWDVCGGGAVCEQRADAAGGWECGAGDGWVRLDGGGGGYLALNSTTGGVPSVAGLMVWVARSRSA